MFQEYTEQVLAGQKKAASFFFKSFDQVFAQSEKWAKSVVEGVPSLGEEQRKALADFQSFSFENGKEAVRIYEDAFSGVDSPEAFAKQCVKSAEGFSGIFLKGSAKARKEMLSGIEKAKTSSPKEFGKFFDVWAETLKAGTDAIEKSVGENLEIAKKTTETAASKKAAK